MSSGEFASLPGKYVATPAAASYLGITDRMVRKLVAEHRIPFHRIGRLVRFSIDDLDAFAASGRVDATGALR